MAAAHFDDHLRDLHDDVVACFERLADLLDRADLLGVQWAGSKPEQGRRKLDGLLRSVRRLELVMPVVAPMKAGKSTLINAMIGYQLLPSRVHPMTTLPTRILIDDDRPLDRPVLHVPESLLDLYQEIEAELGKLLSAGRAVPEGHDYLAWIADPIRAGRSVPLKSEYTGVAEVQNALLRLNDEMRLATLVASSDVFGAIRELPTLTTGTTHGFLRGQHGRGRLVIVDTPGPNEQILGTRLGEVVENQLLESHVILVVMDYTQMGSDAEALIRSQLQGHLREIGRERLYAVVNKVDARRSDQDLSEAATRENVYASLQFEDPAREGRVFEVTADQALTGAQMLLELERDPALVPAGNPTAQMLIRLEFPRYSEARLESTLAAATAQSLRDDAEDLLEQSALRPLLSTVIARLRAQAGAEVIGAGLDRYAKSVVDIREIVDLELAAEDADQRTVADQLKRLGTDLGELQKLHGAIPSEKSLRSAFSHSIDRVVKSVEDSGRQVIAVLAGKKPDSGILSGVSDAIAAPAKRFAQFADKMFGGDDKSSGRRRQEFSTAEQAQQFIDLVTGSTVQSLRSILDAGRAEVERCVQQITVQVVADQELKARGVIVRAAESLGMAFGVRLTVPEPEMAYPELNVSAGEPTVRTHVEKKVEKRVENKRRWFKLFLFKGPKTVTYVKHEQKQVFVVFKDDVVNEIRSTFDAEVSGIRSALNDYIATDVSGALNAYYDGLNVYLERYRDTLNRSVHAGKQTAQERAQRRSELQSLTADLTAEAEQLSGFRAQLGMTAG